MSIKDKLLEFLAGLPADWKSQLEGVIKQWLEDFAEVKCSDIMHCIDVSELSDFTVTGTQVCITFIDQDSTSVSRCFDYIDIMNYIMQQSDPQCLTDQTTWDASTFTEKWQMIIDQTCSKTCIETTTTTTTTTTPSSTTTTTTVMAACTEYELTNNSEENVKFFYIPCGGAVYTAIDVSPGTVTICAVTGTVSVQDCPTCTVIAVGTCP